MVWPLTAMCVQVTNMSTVPPHPNVLKLLAACTEENRLALVTE